MKVRIRNSVTTSIIVIAVISFLLGELVLRAVIWLEIPYFRNPDLYADSTTEDLYFTLEQLWKQRPVAIPDHVIELDYDPLLGWAPVHDSENPLGIVAQTPYSVYPEKQTILFFGNSRVEGVTSMAQKIPQVLDGLMNDAKVYNYGVRAYGLDQIYLRFQKSHAQFKDPIIVFGVLIHDIDRNLFTFRGWPKPYFRIENDKLVLHGVPVPADHRRWLKEHPVRIKSYLIAFFLTRLKAYFPWKQQEKIVLAGKIIEALQTQISEKSLRVLAVIFGESGWRKDTLKSGFELNGISYLDVREILTERAKNEGIDPMNAYFTNKALNERGNRAVAEAVRFRLKQAFGV